MQDKKLILTAFELSSLITTGFNESVHFKTQQALMEESYAGFTYEK
jgi:hypothetical protein